MKKKLLKICYPILVLLVFNCQNASASHIAGGEISIVFTGIPNNYLITYKHYRDCSGISAPTAISLCYSSVICSDSGTVNLYSVPGTGNLLPAHCIDTTLGGTTCNGGTGYGIQQYVYEGNLTLPFNCSDWKFEYAECCRNAVSTFAVNPGLYINADFNNLNYPTNSAPIFNPLPAIELCINSQQIFDAGAFDIDNDSLVYSLINAQDAAFGCPYQPFDVIYVSPYSGLNPLSTTSGITIDPTTGVLSFTPNLIQYPTIDVKCEEYDRTTQQLKSVIRRDFQVKITNTCIVNTPSYDSTILATGINILVDGASNIMCDDTVLYIYLNPPVQCNSIVPSDIRFRNVNGNNNPVSSAIGINCTLGLTDTVMITLVNPIMAGTSYLITKMGNDGNTFLSACGWPMEELDTLYVYLTDSSSFDFAVTDTVDCVFDSLMITCNQQINCSTFSNGSDFKLTDANGLVVPVTGVNCTGQLPGGFLNNSFTLYTQINGGITGPLTLVAKNGIDGNTFSSACGSFINEWDTIGQIHIRNSMSINLGNDVTICSNDSAIKISAGQLPSYINFEWTLNNVPFSVGTSTISANSDGTYILTATASASCFASDTIVVNINPALPVDLGDDVILCSITNAPQLDAGTGGVTYQWYHDNVILTNDILQFYSPVIAGLYSVQVNSADNCIASDTVLIGFAADTNFVVTIFDNNSNVTDSILYCSGVNFPVLALTNSLPGFSYNWSFNGFASSNATLAVNSTGLYSVIVTNPFGCNASDDILVIDDCGLKLPNVFTPNGDGINDFFETPGIMTFSKRKLKVYDRWGLAVFNADPYNNDWDGGNLPSGIHSFFYSLELANGTQSVSENGHLQIIKP